MKNGRFEIDCVNALEILDSRGVPTVRAYVTLASGHTGVASVPSGASTGKYEACELRDSDMSRFGGKGCRIAVGSIVEKLGPAVRGMDAREQREIDRVFIEADGSENKSNLGANAILAVSLAVARAAAAAEGVSLARHIGGISGGGMPVPMMNIINGGAHASNNLDIQEFMILPIGMSSFMDGLIRCTDVYRKLKAVLKERGYSTGVGDEGGFAPDLKRDEEALELILEATERAGYKPGEEMALALDVAASEWAQDDGSYKKPKAGKVLNGDRMLKYWKQIARDYPVVSVEDGAGEDDIELWQRLTSALGDKAMLVGDDFFVTNITRLEKGIISGAANAILIKPNQIGTLTETLDVIKYARENGYATVISHRSGETADTAIADIAVGTGAGYIKTGAPCRSERVEKYNRLLELEAGVCF